MFEGGTVIENFIGGSGDDQVVDSRIANVFTESLGNDSYDGSGGYDTLTFRIQNPRTLDIAEYRNVEDVTGSAHDDVIAASLRGSALRASAATTSSLTGVRTIRSTETRAPGLPALLRRAGIVEGR